MGQTAERINQFLLILVLSFFLFQLPLVSQPNRSKLVISIRPEPAKLEEELFTLINEERQKKGLSQLRLSLPLTLLARQHSQDMAAQNRCSHLSSKGESYIERLIRGGFFFIQAGENVSCSETFSTTWIHQLIMESQAHRENILNPHFDEVGLGVVKGEKDNYFVTQDFIQSRPIVSIEEAKTSVFSFIQNFRQTHRLPSISLDEEASEIAQMLAQVRAKKEPQPPLPQSLGEAFIVFLITPLLDDLTQIEPPLLDPRYNALGLGIAFGRDADHPGGTYFLTLIFRQILSQVSISLESMRNIVWNSMNEIRFVSRLNRLRLKPSLCQQAERIGLNYLDRKKQEMIPLELSPDQVSVFYFTEKLDYFPDKVKALIRNPFCQQVGVHVILTKTEDFPKGVYLVILIFK
ncbi:MAG: CAP domain-containing protein [Candidatus Aminicenantes bacterium]|nr:CAP domain-containing protein [Candidatus Aminicenantes bacterium]